MSEEENAQERERFDRFEASDKRFDEGRKANDIGDSFDLDGVIYTVSLFFAGIGLVFKTKIRWYFFHVGVFVFLIGTAYLLKLQRMEKSILALRRIEERTTGC